MIAQQSPYGEVPMSPYGGGTVAYTLPGTSFYQPQIAFAYAPSQGVASFDPAAQSALQNSFVAQGDAGLAAVTSIGAYEYANTAGLLQAWGSNLNTLSENASAVFANAVSKSAQACSGFFGCLF